MRQEAVTNSAFGSLCEYDKAVSGSRRSVYFLTHPLSFRYSGLIPKVDPTRFLDQVITSIHFRNVLL